ncbi:MAG TPA: YgaP-like transmembrane domain, partial [Phycisphaerales bacterium]|nr:YgaP-like transmembrane domain [Phycisphaerales bacterium]
MNTPQPFAAGLEHGESLGDHHNISRLERWISGVAGTALVTYGLKKRSIPGLGMALFGGMLLRRGATGHCDLYQALGIDTAGSTAGGVLALLGVRVLGRTRPRT